MIKLVVESYLPHPCDYHRCRDAEGWLHRVDLLVDGGLGKVSPESLVGKTVWCKHLLKPCIETASGVSLEEKKCYRFKCPKCGRELPKCPDCNDSGVKRYYHGAHGVEWLTCNCDRYPSCTAARKGEKG